MTLHLAQLIAAGITPAVARVFLPHLLLAADRFTINTPRRMAAFIGQCGHESSAFTRLEENLYYTDPARIARMFSALRQVERARAYVGQPKALANVVYANRCGNAGVESSDGWTYRGRGLIQLTFRSNYRAAEKGTGMPFEAKPELAAQPEGSTVASGWFWQTHGLNAFADDWQIDTITARINPAMVGRADRAERCNRALDALLSLA